MIFIIPFWVSLELYDNSPAELALLVNNQRKKLSQQAVGLKQKSISGFQNKPENVRLETPLPHLIRSRFRIANLPQENTSTPKSKWQEE